MVDDQWYCLVAGRQYGPVSREELVRRLQSGRMAAGDYVWNPSMDDWQSASSIPDLAPEGAGDAGPSPGSAAPPPPIPPYAPAYGAGAALNAHRGGLVLALGILSLVVWCLILGIVAWVMGNKDLREMDAGRMDPTGRSLTQAGRICGIIAVLLQLAGLTVMLLFQIPFLLMMLRAGTSGM